MLLNDISAGDGARTNRKRVGRGMGSGLGKTAGRGHKGHKARSGGSRKAGFEGGQMPQQRRLPKFGFTSRGAQFNAEVRLSELAKVDADVVDAASLKAARVIDRRARRIKIIASGSVDKAFNIKGIKVTKGAREAIEAAGGSIAE